MLVWFDYNCMMQGGGETAAAEGQTDEGLVDEGDGAEGGQWRPDSSKSRGADDGRRGDVKRRPEMPNPFR